MVALAVLMAAPAIATAEPAPVDVPLFAPAQEPRPQPQPQPKAPREQRPAPPSTADDAPEQDASEAEAVDPALAKADAAPASVLEADAEAEGLAPADAIDEDAAPEADDPLPLNDDALAEDLPALPTTAAAAAAADEPASERRPSEANDSPVTVTTKIGPDPSLVGDLLTLEVTAAYPTGYRVNLPTGVDFSPLHLVEIVEGDPEASGEGYFRKVFTVTLQHFEVGEAKVPSFPLTYVGAGGEVETVRVASRPFTVDSLLANEADPERKLEDPPIALEYPNTTAELIIYSAAVAMLAGFFLALFWRRLASRRKVVLGPPPVPAHEVALSALVELERSEFLETGLVQDYYLELTEIAKGYLEGRFGVDALDRTTEEIRRDLERQRDRIKPLKPDDVIRFLEGCDLVKFARFDPELDEARSALGEVRTMVEETKPREVVSAFAGELGAGAAADSSATGSSAAEPADASAEPAADAPADDGAGDKLAEAAGTAPASAPASSSAAETSAAEEPKQEPKQKPKQKPEAEEERKA